MRPNTDAEAARVREAVAGLAAAEAELRAAVGAMRAAGAPWSVIGDALGVTRQTAHERFAAHCPPVNVARVVLPWRFPPG